MRCAAPHRTRFLTRLVTVTALSLVASGSALVAASPVASSGAAASASASQRGTAGDNPLAGREWGVYKGPAEMAWAPYVKATGKRKARLATIALAPKAKWFGAWIPDRDIASKVEDYIATSQEGNPDALVQLAVFRMDPWEHEACRRLPTKAEKKSYRVWTRRFARAVGDTPTALILQPDGPFALCAPGGSKVHSRLIAYSTRVYSALPNTSVYIDAGAADWPAPGAGGGVNSAVKLLVRAGVKHARGFAPNSTHYSSTDLEVERGTEIVEALERRGIEDKRFVVNTSSNGHPFPFGTYTGSDSNNAGVCRTKNEPASTTCISLGIPPTTEVADPRWGLAALTNERAARHVDAYLWFGRPWLHRQASPFVMKRALRLVRSSPY